MELVYLWVEKYKNIEKQGFNFSPRFKCEYDEKTNELTINEKKDYVSIFPDNINITAIVGENGSGKSSILENIFDFLNRSSNIKYFVIYKLGEGLNLYIQNINIQNKGELQDINISTSLNKFKNFVCAYIDNVDSEFKDKRSSQNYLFVENNKIDINFNSKMILSNYLEEKNRYFKNVRNEFFVPDRVQIKFKIEKLDEDETLYDEKNNKGNYKQEYLDEIENIKDLIKKDLQKGKYKNFIENIEKLMQIKRENFQRIGLQFGFQFGGNFYSNDSLEDKYKCKEIVNNNPIVIDDLKGKGLPSDIFYEWSTKEVTKEVYKFIDSLPTLLFDIELYDGKKSLLNLSYGERQLIVQMNKILHYSQKLDSIDNNSQKINNILILLDEFEAGLHPNWQKQFVSYLMDFLKEVKDKNFQIIFTSHSPFILSDLPKDNVIFLEKGKQVYPFGDNQQTFGANIHTLLSHGFFMQNGLMGEFAKDKINEVYEYLTNSNTQSKLTQKDAQNIINLIGEPILKKELQSIYDKKFQVDDIDKKIREHQEAIIKLESQRNNND